MSQEHNKIQELLDRETIAMNFRDLIHDRIVELGDDNHTPPVIDPYRRQPLGIPIRPSYDTSTTADGRIKFGKDYDTHHLRLEDEDRSYELIYVRNRKPDHQWLAARGAFYVHEFSPRGGVAARTFFFQTDKEKIRKIRMTNFDAARAFGGGHDLVRDLRPKEVEKLKLGIAEPQIYWSNILGAIALSKREEASVAKNQEERRQAAAQLANDLEEIRQARHRAAVNAHNIFLR